MSELGDAQSSVMKVNQNMFVLLATALLLFLFCKCVVLALTSLIIKESQPFKTKNHGDIQ